MLYLVSEVKKVFMWEMCEALWSEQRKESAFTFGGCKAKCLADDFNANER
jgi:hypothetical protein